MHATTSTIFIKFFFQVIFTSLFATYLFIKSFLQSSLTLPSSIPQHFFNSLFLRKAILTIHIKSVFSILHLFSQFRLRRVTIEQGSLVRSNIVLISLFFLKVSAGITGLPMTHSLSLRLRKLPVVILQVLVSDEDGCSRMENDPIHLLPYPQTNVITSIPF